MIIMKKKMIMKNNMKPLDGFESHLEPEIRIEIIENKISLFLVNNKKEIIAKSSWTDNRDLSKKLLPRIDLLLKRKKIALNNISKFDFISFEKCGFTTKQIGEITAKVLNI